MRPSTVRFSDRVEDYVRYRPGYPASLVERLQIECGLTQESVVADIGSGPGALATLFLDLGARVIAVEPNREMREAGQRLLGDQPNYLSVDGTAESTYLAGASVEFVVAGQAFHWFDPEKARAEFQRILRPGGWVALVWNDHRREGDPFSDGYEALLKRVSPEYSEMEHRDHSDAHLESFFGARPSLFQVANDQPVDLEGLLGRARSASYFPKPPSPVYDEAARGLEALFAATSKDGKVVFRHESKMYYGRLQG